MNFRKNIHTLVLALAGLSLPAMAGATTLYVDQTPCGSCGSHWANAYTDLQEALKVATSGDVVWIADGTYTVGSSGSCNVPLMMRDGVTLLGGFNGTEATSYNPANRNLSANITTITGDINSSGDFDEGDTDVLFNFLPTNVNALTTIDGIRFSTSQTALRTSAGNLRFNDCWFTGFRSSSGVLDVHEASVDLYRCRFENNLAHDFGAMVLSVESDLYFEGCRFTNNVSTGIQVFAGSVLNPSNSTVQFYNSAFYQNGNSGNRTIPHTTANSVLSLINCSFHETEMMPTSIFPVYSMVNVRNCLMFDQPTLDHLQSVTTAGMLVIVNSVIPPGYTATYSHVTDPSAWFNNLPNSLSIIGGTVAEGGGDDAFNGTLMDIADNPRKNGTIDIGAYEYCPSCNIFKMDVEEEEVEESFALRVFPNPARDQVVIESDEDLVSIMLIDIYGKQVLAEQRPGTTNRSTLDVSQLARGLYFVRVQSGDHNETHQILLQ